MARNRAKFALSLSLMSMASLGILNPSSQAAIGETGGKGANVYCYMRENGNSHEVSWSASYEVIKRQTNGLFKTSPKHAAVMITEAVVKEPSSFNNCGRYLGDLFRGGETQSESVENQPNTQSSSESGQRYNY